MTSGGGRPGDPSPKAFPPERSSPDRRRWITALALAIVLLGTAGALTATSRPSDVDGTGAAQLAVRPRSIPPTTTTGPPAPTPLPALPTTTTHVHTSRGTPAPILPPGLAATDGESTGEDGAAAELTVPPTTTTQPPDTCTAEDLNIGLEFTKPSYALGELITATGSITNTSEQTCGPIRGHEAWFIDPDAGYPVVLPLPVGYPCPAEADCSTPPGAGREFPVCWTQAVMRGDPIQPGTYQVVIYGYLPGMVESFDLVITDAAPPATTIPFECNPFRNGAVPATSWKSIAAG